MPHTVNTVADGEQRVWAAERAIGWSAAVAASVFVAYLAWWSVLPRLWHWANETWWHWIPASFGFMMLVGAPVWVAMYPPHVGADRSDVNRRRLWRWAGFVGWVAFVLLVIWALMPRPSWWASWHWWLWNAAILAFAAGTAGARMFLTECQTDVTVDRGGFSREWRFNHHDVHSPPALGVAMSGGGIRSAAFNLGVLQALHDLNILRSVDVLSAVSGGSYTMSWYLLQPFYAASAAAAEGTAFDIDAVIDDMFDNEGRFQEHLSARPSLFDVPRIDRPGVLSWALLLFTMAIPVLINSVFGQLLRPFPFATPGLYNKTSTVREGYRAGIQRLFHGRPSPDSPGDIENKISAGAALELSRDFSDFCVVTPVGYRELAGFAEEHELPFFIFNAAVLVERRVRDELWATAFELTADDLGSDAFGYRAWDDLRELEAIQEPDEPGRTGLWHQVRSFVVPPKREERRENQWILMANLAPAISGAAIGLSYFNPKKPLRTMRLTTWTPFIANLDLGYLFPRSLWSGKGTLYLSDGGHAENLGAYALIKRQCRTIIVVDAEHEPDTPYVFSAYRKLQERLGDVSLEVPALDRYLEAAEGPDKPTGPPNPVMIGEIRRGDASHDAGKEPMATVIYIKLALDRNHLDAYPDHIQRYAGGNDRFPQDPTSDQSFTSDQFIAYRDLGHHTVFNSAAITLWAWCRQQLNRSALPEERTVVAFSFTDQPPGHRDYWLLIERGDAEVCYSDPGGDPDVDVQAELHAFVDWHCGELSWSTAIRTGQITVTGRRDLVCALPTWNSHEPTLTRT